MTRLREPGYIGQALDVALGIEAPEARRRALRLIGPSLTSLTREERGRIWAGSTNEPTLIRRLATASRPLLMEDVAALAPVIATAGGRLAVSEVFDAVVDVTEWWPDCVR